MEKGVSETKPSKVDYELFSSFQPIYSFANQACIGAEALIRGKDLTTGKPLTVPECLNAAFFDYLSGGESDTRKINDLHLKSWSNNGLPNSWLFLNLDIGRISNIEDVCLSELMEKHQFANRSLVVEVVEKEIQEEGPFVDVVQLLRNSGCLIALDDFGAGHSNIDRIWRVEPDIVKLDRGVLLEATNSRKGRSVLKNLTSLITEAGSICLLEGIETKDQALLAMDAGVDLVQGFYFAKPSPSLESFKVGKEKVAQVVSGYPEYILKLRSENASHLKGYESLFSLLTSQQTREELESKLREFESLVFVKKVYILNDTGVQISSDKVTAKGYVHLDMKKGKGLSWRNRPYFLNAMQHPGELYVSKPYRSLLDMRMCVTVSKKITLQDQVVVACIDFESN